MSHGHQIFPMIGRDTMKPIETHLDSTRNDISLQQLSPDNASSASRNKRQSIKQTESAKIDISKINKSTNKKKGSHTPSINGNDSNGESNKESSTPIKQSFNDTLKSPDSVETEGSRRRQNLARQASKNPGWRFDSIDNDVRSKRSPNGKKADMAKKRQNTVENSSEKSGLGIGTNFQTWSHVKDIHKELQSNQLSNAHKTAHKKSSGLRQSDVGDTSGGVLATLNSSDDTDSESVTSDRKRKFLIIESDRNRHGGNEKIFHSKSVDEKSVNVNKGGSHVDLLLPSASASNAKRPKILSQKDGSLTKVDKHAKSFIQPKCTPFRDKAGMFIRPVGRRPTGYSWNAFKGIWVLMNPSDQLENSQENKKESLTANKIRYNNENIERHGDENGNVEVGNVTLVGITDSTGNKEPPLEVSIKLKGQGRGRPRTKPVPETKSFMQPKWPPIRDDDGTFFRPAGRRPTGYLWNMFKGLWVLDTSLHSSEPFVSKNSDSVGEGSLTRDGNNPLKEDDNGSSQPVEVNTDMYHSNQNFDDDPSSTLLACEPEHRINKVKAKVISKDDRNIDRKSDNNRPCIQPKSPPLRDRHGSFLRPPGRCPVGYFWNSSKGIWVPNSNAEMINEEQTEIVMKENRPNIQGKLDFQANSKLVVQSLNPSLNSLFINEVNNDSTSTKKHVTHVKKNKVINAKPAARFIRPKLSPLQDKYGSYIRPVGRFSTGYTWNSNAGLWILKEEVGQSDSTASDSKILIGDHSNNLQKYPRIHTKKLSNRSLPLYMGEATDALSTNSTLKTRETFFDRVEKSHVATGGSRSSAGNETSDNSGSEGGDSNEDSLRLSLHRSSERKTNKSQMRPNEMESSKIDFYVDPENGSNSDNSVEVESIAIQKTNVSSVNLGYYDSTESNLAQGASNNGNESKLALERSRFRPRMLPRLSLGGSFRRPKGRPPVGHIWDSDIGEWIISTEKQANSSDDDTIDDVKNAVSSHENVLLKRKRSSLIPVVVNHKSIDGSVRQPKGRPPTGCIWDSQKAEWVPSLSSTVHSSSSIPKRPITMKLVENNTSLARARYLEEKQNRMKDLSARSKKDFNPKVRSYVPAFVQCHTCQNCKTEKDCGSCLNCKLLPEYCSYNGGTLQSMAAYFRPTCVLRICLEPVRSTSHSRDGIDFNGAKNDGQTNGVVGNGLPHVLVADVVKLTDTGNINSCANHGKEIKADLSPEEKLDSMLGIDTINAEDALLGTHIIRTSHIRSTNNAKPGSPVSDVVDTVQDSYPAASVVESLSAAESVAADSDVSDLENVI